MAEPDSQRPGINQSRSSLAETSESFCRYDYWYTRLVRGVKNGVNHVELNFYPPSSTARSDFWSGDGATIMKNALLYR